MSEEKSLDEWKRIAWYWMTTARRQRRESDGMKIYAIEQCETVTSFEGEVKDLWITQACYVSRNKAKNYLIDKRESIFKEFTRNGYPTEDAKNRVYFQDEMLIADWEDTQGIWRIAEWNVIE